MKLRTDVSRLRASVDRKFAKVVDAIADDGGVATSRLGDDLDLMIGATPERFAELLTEDEAPSTRLAAWHQFAMLGAMELFAQLAMRLEAEEVENG